MTVPIFARKDPDNTVNVLDGVFVSADKFALLTADEQAAALLTRVAEATEQTAAGNSGAVNYAYTFVWAGGKISTVTRDSGTAQQTATFTYDVDGNLAGVSSWT